MSTDEMLAVENVRAGYQSDIDILQGVSLSAAARRLTLVIGPNGAGKSTLLKTIFGFLKAHNGTIRLREHRIEKLEPHEVKAFGIGYFPQEINIFPLLTVEENLRMGGWTLRREPARLRTQLAKIYEVFPVLADRRRSPAGDLSGGQGRMLSVAREMVAQPKLLLIDEPTAGLAPNLVERVYELLQVARRALEATILLVDQNVEDALAQADYVYMMNLGTVKAHGPAATFTPTRVRDLVAECLLG
jgi:ABC-type branched-subunit amino acid transport system ATPase component